MSTTTLTDTERKVLEALAAEPDAWLNYFYHGIVAAAGGVAEADAICRDLRRRKLVDAQGRGKWAQYGINDKGREALKT